MRASLSPPALRAFGGLARDAAPVIRGAATSPAPRRWLGDAAGLVGRALSAEEALRGAGAGPRHPLAPSAIRVERSRSRRGEERADQTAVTLWFGPGPALPGAGGGPSALRVLLRVGAGALAAGAVAAASAYAARLEAAPPPRRLLDAPALPPRGSTRG